MEMCGTRTVECFVDEVDGIKRVGALKIAGRRGRRLR
jgi:hypothetical protein